MSSPHNRRGNIRVATRPEAWRVIGGESLVSSQNLAGKINTAAFQGSHYEYTVTTDLGELLVFDRDLSRSFTPGTTVALALDAHTLALLA